MAKYLFDFSSYPINQQPSDWSKFWATYANWTVRAAAGAIGEKVLENQKTGSPRYPGFRPTEVPNTSDAEILVKIKISSASASPGLVLRGSGIDGSERGYVLWLAQGDLYEYISGQYFFTGITLGVINMQAGIYYWFRFRIDGQTLRGKRWEDGTEEPTTWNFESQNSSITGTGWAGLALFSDNVNHIITYDFVGIATDGDTVTLGPELTYPVNTPVIPGELTTFRWEAEQEAYELEYREAGASLWTSTGQITSSTPEHVFPPGTFEPGKNYEWRCRIWDDPEGTANLWATPAQFNTIYPLISPVSPTPDTSTSIGIKDIAAIVKSPFGRQSSLTATIADNPEFDNAATYTWPLSPHGHRFSEQHAITSTGTWYLRLVATDSEGVQSELKYSFLATQQLYFIDIPQVTIHPPRATHVTVMVRGTSISATAVVDPPPPADKVIERLVEIDSGTQATCARVAAELIDKWGQEQKSVKGQIPLTVTLDYLTKVWVTIPWAGIDEAMPLQSKAHYVIPEAMTEVELGYISLSDEEVIARTLDGIGQQAMTSLYSVQMLGVELSEREISDIEQGQELSDTDITVIEMGGDDAID